MRFLHLTLLYSVLMAFSSDTTSGNPQSSPATILEAVTADSVKTTDSIQASVVKARTTNVIFQSKDGGQTWQDITQGLPEREQPQGFFAGESELYLRVKNVMYRSKNNLDKPVWKKEEALDPRGSSIAFNRSGVVAYNYDGYIFQKRPTAGTWSPIHTNFNKHLMRTIFETSDGTVFIGTDLGLYKSTNRGQSWRQVQNEGWVMDFVEEKGVLIATGQNGIMRSTDNGEHWEWVISEGGVGIAIERIEGGFAAISYSAAAKTRRVRASFDSGKTWTAIDDGIQSLSITSIKQIGKYLIVGHPAGIFRSSDMGKTWNIVHPNVNTNEFKFEATLKANPVMEPGMVFTIYASGNVLYAVAGYDGC